MWRLPAQLKNKYFLLSVLLAALVMVTPHPVYAGIGDWIAGILYEVVVSVFGTIAGWCGMLLNYALYLYTIGFGSIYKYTGLGVAIDSLWSIVRDVFNLAFIFGLVWIGIKLILDSEDSQARKALVSLILAALLINFSLFFTKAIIDSSNIITEAIAEQGFRPIGQPKTVNLGAKTIQVKDVSGVFVDLMDLTTIYNQTSNGGSVNVGSNVLASIDSGGKWALVFITMLILLIAAFVFAAGAFLLIVRFVVLNYYLVLSPLMFLGMVIPNFQNFTNDWWKGFLRSAFVAPAYVFLLYLAAYTLDSFKGFVTSNSNNLSQAITNPGGTGVYSIIPFFVVIAGFLLGSVIVAQKMGVAGSATVMKVGNDLAGRGKRALGASTIGLAARGGRNTIGYGAQRAADSKWMKKRAANSVSGRLALKALRGVGDSSFDARKIGGVGKQLGIGEGKKGGYASRVKEDKEEAKKFADSLGTTKVRDAEGRLTQEAKEVLATDKRAQAAQTNLKSKEDDLTSKKELAATAAEAVATAQSALEARRSRLNSDTKSERDQITTLTQQRATASDDEKKVIDNRINALQSSIQAKTGNAEAELKALEAEVVAAEARAKTAQASVATAAEAAVKAQGIMDATIEYNRQLDFIDQKSREAGRYKIGLAGGASSGVGSTVAGGVVSSSLIGAGIGGGIGTVAALSSRGEAHLQQQVVEELLKQYGADGTAAKKSKDEKAKMKILAEQLKESGEAPKPAGDE